MASKKGNWVKVTGGDHGAIYNGRRWEGFACLICARVEGLINTNLRKGMGDHGRAVNMAMQRGWVHTCKGADQHRQFYQMKANGDF